MRSRRLLLIHENVEDVDILKYSVSSECEAIKYKGQNASQAIPIALAAARV